LHSPPSPAEISGTIETCAKAAVFFADFDISWQAAWQATPYYSDEWSGQLAPDVPGDNLVFNYTYTLPQFLRAIYILLTTIGALDPTSLSYYQPTLRSCLTRLSAVHDTIVSSGIVGTRVPKTSEVGIVGHVPETGFPTVWLTDWFDRRNQLMWPHGDVERYSGASSVASYFFYEIDMDRLDRDTQNNFVRLIQLRIAQQKKALYSQLGLPEARQVINQLRSMTGQPPLADAPYENWSIKEALGIMGLPLAASARSLLSVVKATPPFGGGWEYTPHPDPFSYTWRPGRPLPAGLRGLLAGY